ncbi:MAG: glycerate kinase, partial [Candidatus Omnitrophica bacterium]|nr:glycerate kinase [Candidatus Omnitrophota bacterium]
MRVNLTNRAANLKPTQKPFKVILAFDSYKGALSAIEACAAAAEGIKRVIPTATIIHIPLSDGGEGFAAAMQIAGGGETLELEITGPLFEKRIATLIFLDGRKIAVVESAYACGLELVPPPLRSPKQTTTVGLGEMLIAAQRAGAHQVIIGIGGSATNDAGMGLLNALGWRFLGEKGVDLAPIGASLSQVQQIVPGEKLPELQITVACDVNNPLYGPQGAAYVYAAQKGATRQEIIELDKGLEHFAHICADFLKKDFSSCPGAGAAGGLGFALAAFLNARLSQGAEVAIKISGLRSHLVDANICLTGEGQCDQQTVYGKLPSGVAIVCKDAG